MGTGSEPLSPPAFLRLAGHPLRWQLLLALAGSDRQVHELTALSGEPQSLVSYHLGKLREAKLVTMRRSTADGRDAYYSADLTRIGELLAQTGAAIHPALRASTPSSRRRRHRVLFLCTGNSARSQMAEALTRSRSGGAVAAFSAGSHPKPLHPNAVLVMRERGISLRGYEPKHFDVFARRRFDRVISLCDRVRELRPEFPGHPTQIHWSIPDPAASRDGVAAFERTAAELETRIGFLLADITAEEAL